MAFNETGKNDIKIFASIEEEPEPEKDIAMSPVGCTL